MKHRAGSYLALALGVIALSTSAIFVKLANAPSSIIAFYRLLFTALALTPFLLLDKNKRAQLRSLDLRRMGLIALSGLLLAVHYVCGSSPCAIPLCPAPRYWWLFSRSSPCSSVSSFWVSGPEKAPSQGVSSPFSAALLSAGETFSSALRPCWVTCWPCPPPVSSACIF